MRLTFLFADSKSRCETARSLFPAHEVLHRSGNLQAMFTRQPASGRPHSLERFGKIFTMLIGHVTALALAEGSSNSLKARNDRRT